MQVFTLFHSVGGQNIRKTASFHKNVKEGQKVGLTATSTS